MLHSCRLTSLAWYTSRCILLNASIPFWFCFKYTLPEPFLQWGVFGPLQTQIGMFSIIDIWIRRDKGSEEVHSMEEPQPIIVRPIVRVPQVPPQQVAGNRRVYIAPALNRLPVPLYTYLPLPQAYTQNRFVYIPPRLKPPSNLQQSSVWQRVPETPGLLSFGHRPAQFSSSGRTQPEMPMRASHPGVPVTPSCSIPGYFATRLEREEPGVAETLMGCGILLLLGLIALVLLYYLST